MCGIFGAIGKYDVNDFKLLAVSNITRGDESSGILTKDFKTLRVLKNNKDIKDLISENIKMFSAKHDYILGHTRLATHGGITKENAHPFENGNIIGAHNGTVWNFMHLKEKYKLTMDVDSEMIFWLINNFGIDKALDELSGQICIWFVDKRNSDIVHILKHGGELSIYLSDGKIYFSSNIFDLKLVKSRDGYITNLKEDSLYSIDTKSVKFSKRKVKFSAAYTPCYYYGRNYADDEYYGVVEKRYPIYENIEKKSDKRKREYLCQSCGEVYTFEEIEKNNGHCLNCHVFDDFWTF